MDNHPIPQNVTGFEFKLIGDMTLKQFVYLAVGALTSYLIFLIPLPLLFKIIPMLFSLLTGIAFAFVPVSGRPLDRMILNFLRAVLSKDQYVFGQTHVAAQPAQATTPASEAVPVQSVPVQVAAPIIEAAPINAQTIEQVNSSTFASTPPPTPLTSQPARDASASVAGEPQVAPQPEVPVVQMPAPLTTTVAHVATQPSVQASVASEPTPRSPQLSFPNVLTGAVKDVKGDIIPGIIVEVQDSNGITLRAFKTNKLGQFSASTALPNGSYTLVADDPMGRYVFEPVQVTLSGTVVPTLELKPKDARDQLRKELFLQ